METNRYEFVRENEIEEIWFDVVERKYEKIPRGCDICQKKVTIECCVFG